MDIALSHKATMANVSLTNHERHCATQEDTDSVSLCGSLGNQAYVTIHGHEEASVFSHRSEGREKGLRICDKFHRSFGVIPPCCSKVREVRVGRELLNVPVCKE